MKKLLLFAAIVFATVACTDKNAYTVKGNVENKDLNGQTVFLRKLVDKQLTPVDSAVIADGKFTFKGQIEMPEIYYIEIPRLGRFGFILESTKIDFTIGENFYTVSGTEFNNEITDFNKQKAKIVEKMNDIEERYENAKTDGSITQELENSLDAEYKIVEKELKDFGVDFLTKNINNKIGECFVGDITRRLEPDEIEKLLALANEETLNSERFITVAERLKIAKTVAIGQPFVDLEMPNPQGKMIKLSDYAGKGKYVLVDFWASWCKPCREEMPTLVELYKKYKNKKFEIVGVSFDRDKEKWLNGIAELNITWVQMSDIKYWQSEGAKLYNVLGIPHTVLIDPKGIIIEKNLLGNALKNKLEELIK